MLRTDELSNRSAFNTWIAASFAFALLTGVCLAIPLSQGLRYAPTGYAVAGEPQPDGTADALRDFVGDVAGTCVDCPIAKLTDRIPPSASEIPGIDV
jgi:hypothetical protein